jgi:hypothetical protein
MFKTSVNHLPFSFLLFFVSWTIKFWGRIQKNIFFVCWAWTDPRYHTEQLCRPVIPPKNALVKRAILCCEFGSARLPDSQNCIPQLWLLLAGARSTVARSLSLRGLGCHWLMCIFETLGFWVGKGRGWTTTIQTRQLNGDKALTTKCQTDSFANL